MILVLARNWELGVRRSTGVPVARVKCPRCTRENVLALASDPSTAVPFELAPVRISPGKVVQPLACAHRCGFREVVVLDGWGPEHSAWVESAVSRLGRTA